MTDETARYRSIRHLRHRFRERSVAELYRFRPEYPDELYDLLLGHLDPSPRTVLDAGAGPGKIARRLAPHVDRVDAVDPSEEMLAEARSLPGGDDPRIRFVCAPVEDAVLEAPYGLVVCGASVHWFDLPRALARFAEVLAPGGRLAVLDGDGAWHAPWEAAEREVMIDFVTRMQGQRPVWRVIDIEDKRTLAHPQFALEGARVTAPVEVSQSIEDYLACQHSRATFTPAAMGTELSQAFDDALRAVLAPHARDGVLRYELRTRIEWGRPLHLNEVPAP